MTTILIVDDEVLIAMTTAEMVADFGYHPLEANSGAEALKILQADNEIGVMITDYSMPTMSGGVLIEQARCLRPRLPIILTTGYSHIPDDIKSDIKLLSKPFSNEQLAIALKKVLAAPLGASHDQG